MPKILILTGLKTGKRLLVFGDNLVVQQLNEGNTLVSVGGQNKGVQCQESITQVLDMIMNNRDV